MKSSSRTLSTELLADASMRRTSVTSGRNPKMRGFIHVMNYVKCQKVGRKNLYSKQEVNILIKSGKLAKYGHR